MSVVLYVNSVVYLITAFLGTKNLATNQKKCFIKTRVPGLTLLHSSENAETGGDKLRLFFKLLESD